MYVVISSGARAIKRQVLHRQFSPVNVGLKETMKAGKPGFHSFF
jgi:hypothetical protein